MVNEYAITPHSMSKIEGGLEIYAQAWKNGLQLGFGDDGSVDIERFRIFNPPLLVPDPNGTIVISSVVEGVTITRTFREDPLEAVRQTLARCVMEVGKEGAAIQIGKVGKTTDTIYSANDGTCEFDAGGTWAAAHDASSCTSAYTTDLAVSAYYRTVNSAYYIYRGCLFFDTSGIGTDTVSSASINLDPSTVIVDTNHTSAVNIYSSTAADPFTTSDYPHCGTTPYATSILYGSLTVGTYATWTLNSTGIAAINGSGTTKMSIREATFDVANTAPPFENNPSIHFYPSSTAGTTEDPYLSVTHTAAPSHSGIPQQAKIIHVL